MCDGRKDCRDGVDEASVMCATLIDIQCTLRYGNRTRRQIPAQWIQDGMSDCKGGDDENEDRPTCGMGDTLRYVNAEASESCSEVYLNLCETASERRFIEFSELCDRKGSCGNELRVCSKSRRQHSCTYTSPVYFNGKEQIYICLHGLEDLSIMLASPCDHLKFIYPQHDIVGRNKYPMLYLPRDKVDCKYFYGSIYVFLNCLDLCETSVCPLNNLIKYDSCIGQFPARVYTLADNSYVTFLIKQNMGTDEMSYHNEVFPCKNGLCVEYDKVCNLVDDCGDGTDEMNCTNNFQFKNMGASLSHERVCDGVIDDRLYGPFR